MSKNCAIVSLRAPREDTRPVVLIAEDETAIAAIVALVVEGAGYRSAVALHGRQALGLARDRWPALLITDLMMPYMDGAQLVAALQAEAAASCRSMPPTIVMTAANMAYAHAAGADVILAKPFVLAHLTALLHRFLDTPSG